MRGNHPHCTLVAVCQSEEELRLAKACVPEGMPHLAIYVGKKGLNVTGWPKVINLPEVELWHGDVAGLAQRAAMLYTATWAVIQVMGSDLPQLAEILDAVGELERGRPPKHPKIWGVAREDVVINGFDVVDSQIDPSAPPTSPEQIADQLAETIPMFRVMFDNLQTVISNPLYRRLVMALKDKVQSYDAIQPKSVLLGRGHEVLLKRHLTQVGGSGRVVLLGDPIGDVPPVKRYDIAPGASVCVYAGSQSSDK